MTHAKTVVVWGSEPPAYSIGCCEPMWPGDSGLTIIYADAPDPRDVEPDDPRITLVHVDCLVSDDPGLAAGVGTLATRIGLGSQEHQPEMSRPRWASRIGRCRGSTAPRPLSSR